MTTSAPATPDERHAAELTAFLPQLQDSDLDPVIEWEMQGTNFRPKYAQWVREFFAAAGQECWIDGDYHPNTSTELLNDDELIQSASIPQIKKMLTYCVRGERFNDGLRADLIRNGKVRAIVTRIRDIFAAPEVPV